MTRRSEITFNPNKKHLFFQGLQRELGKWCEHYGFPNVVLPETATAKMEEAVFSFKGRVYAEAIETAFDIIDKLRTDRGVALLGLMQSAKSEVQAMVLILAPLLLKVEMVSFAMTPGDNGLVDQYQRRFQDVFCLFRKAVVDGTEIGAYHCDMMERLSDIPNIQKISGFIRPVLVSPIRKAEMKILLDVVAACEKQNLRLLLCQDECDYGSSESSVVDKTLEDKRLLDECVYDLYRRQPDETRVQIIRVSATNFDWPGVSSVNLRIGSKYIGPNVHPLNTRKRFTTTNIKSPEVRTLRSMAARLGFSTDISPSKYKRALRDRTKKKNRDYERKCNQAILAMVNDLLIDNPIPGANGCLLRFVNTNRHMDNVAAALNIVEDDVCVIKHYGGSEQKLGSVSEHVERRLAEFCDTRGISREEAKYVVLVTGSCRYGENVPMDCLCAIDLSPVVSTTMATLLQGLYGRLCGYKPVAIYITNEVGASMLDEYTSLRYKGRLHSNCQSESPASIIKFCETGYEPEGKVIHGNVVDDLIQKIQNELDRNGNFGRKACKATLFKPYMTRLRQLCKKHEVSILELEQVFLAKRTKKKLGQDKNGGAKVSNDVIVRVDEQGRVLSFEWRADESDDEVLKISPRGGLSSKLKTAA